MNSYKNLEQHRHMSHVIPVMFCRGVEVGDPSERQEEAETQITWCNLSVAFRRVYGLSPLSRMCF
jgi:hypothetical protein